LHFWPFASKPLKQFTPWGKMSVSTAEEKKEYPLGFKATYKQKDELQEWAIFFYQQKSVDPETRKQVPVIGKP
jgi:hypothetical protein